MFVREEVVVAESAERVLRGLETYLRRESSAGAGSDAVADQEDALLRAGISFASKQVVVRTLPPVVHESGADIAMSWSATGPTRNLYPSLEATVSVEAIDAARTRVRIVGSYLPPFGEAGAVVDRMLGHRIASATARSFLARVERYVLNSAPEQRQPRPARIRLAPLTDPGEA